LHSRLLERSAKLSKKYGGGSLTALPIIETQAGDISAYIPTNVISITDGQIFLETNLFYQGIRPAISVGNSVSRVGSSAQTKAVKSVAGSLRVSLAQFRELAAFAQFASDLDAATKQRIERGRRLTELLKQKQYQPMSVAEQTISLMVANEGGFDHVPAEPIKDAQHELLSVIHAEHKDIEKLINKGDKPTDEAKADILKIAKKVLHSFAHEEKKEG
jgi:F-type H+-transporting ATPase subunit alpha